METFYILHNLDTFVCSATKKRRHHRGAMKNTLTLILHPSTTNNEEVKLWISQSF